MICRYCSFLTTKEYSVRCVLYRRVAIDVALWGLKYRGKIELVKLRRLEDRIRELCARVVAVPETEFSQTMRELRKALHLHAERLRQLAAGRISSTERRKQSS